MQAFETPAAAAHTAGLLNEHGIYTAEAFRVIDEARAMVEEAHHPRRCGCREVDSPVAGVIWSEDSWGGGELQRCDTHQPAPLFESDDAAAEAMRAAGYTISEDPSHEGEPRRLFAERA